MQRFIFKWHSPRLPLPASKPLMVTIAKVTASRSEWYRVAVSEPACRVWGRARCLRSPWWGLKWKDADPGVRGNPETLLPQAEAGSKITCRGRPLLQPLGFTEATATAGVALQQDRQAFIILGGHANNRFLWHLQKHSLLSSKMTCLEVGRQPSMEACAKEALGGLGEVTSPGTASQTDSRKGAARGRQTPENW